MTSPSASRGPNGWVIALAAWVGLGLLSRAAGLLGGDPTAARFAEATGWPAAAWVTVSVVDMVVQAAAIVLIWRGRLHGRHLLLGSTALALLAGTLLSPFPRMPYFAAAVATLIPIGFVWWLLFRPAVTEHLTGRPRPPAESWRGRESAGSLLLTAASALLALGVLLDGFRVAADPQDEQAARYLLIVALVPLVVGTAATLGGLLLIDRTRKPSAAGYLLVATAAHVTLSGLILVGLEEGWFDGGPGLSGSSLHTLTGTLPPIGRRIFASAAALALAGGACLGSIRGRQSDPSGERRA